MDGPPSYIINVETIRESNASWEPPASLASPEYFIQDNEPNSIGFYQDIKGLNNESEMWTNYASKQLYIYADFMNIPGLKVLEREKIEKLTQEADLSQSGLVNPETGINKGSLMKEEVAVIVKADLSLKVIEYIIQSKKSEQKVTVTGVTPENMSYAVSAAKKHVYNAINKSLTNPLIPIIDR